MPINVSSKGGADFAPIQSGIHQAICYGVVDIGTQRSKNPAHGPKKKLVIIWELPHERADFGEDKKNQPRAISQTFTQSLSTKSLLRPALESWRGKPFTEVELNGFDPKVLIGVNCQLNIIHETRNDKTYANIKSIVPLGKGQPKLAQENPSLYFSLDDQTDLKNIVYPANMPSWLKEKIAFCEEVLAAHGDSSNQDSGQQSGTSKPATPQENIDEDVPF